LSRSHRIPFELPFAETEGETAGKRNASEVSEVGDLERRPEPPALNENAFTKSAVWVISFALPK